MLKLPIVPPQASLGKNTDQDWIKVNFASNTFSHTDQISSVGLRRSPLPSSTRARIYTVTQKKNNTLLSSNERGKPKNT